MKICFITTGDIENIATSKRALGMANPLIELGWEVHIIMEDVEGNHKRVEMECNSKVQLHYFKSSSALMEVKSKSRIINNLQPDYIYLCAFVFRNIIHPKSKKIKKLVEHSELQSSIPDIKGGKKLLVKLLEYYSIIYSDGLLCASKYLETVYLKKSKIIRKKISILHFPYAFSKDMYMQKETSELPEEFLNYKDKLNFVFLGSITKNYGAFTMLEAFLKLTKTHKGIRLILLGKGRHYQEAINFVKEHDLNEFVYMPGFIKETDISNYFSVADFFISPMQDTIQDWARCPSKLYMYLPFKKPVITCKIGEPHHVIGQKGYYFEPNSSKSLNETISNLLNRKEISDYVAPEIHTWEQRSTDFDRWIKQ